MAKIDFGGEKENVVTRKEFSLAKARRILKKETIAVIGYGVQGPALNELHDDIRGTLVFSCCDNEDNVLVAQPSQGTGLAP